MTADYAGVFALPKTVPRKNKASDLEFSMRPDYFVRIPNIVGCAVRWLPGPGARTGTLIRKLQLLLLHFERP